MTEEAGDDTHSLESIAQQFNADYIYTVVDKQVDAIRVKLNGAIHAVQGLLPYLSGLYYTDRQRREAEVRLRQLQIEITELTTELTNSLVIAPTLHRPVTINT